MILLEERIETLKQLPKQTKETVELYRFQISLVINCLPVSLIFKIHFYYYYY